MNSENPDLTIYDLFIRGKVGAIFGYPSTIRSLELAKKRAGDGAVDGIILTAAAPQIASEGK